MVAFCQHDGIWGMSVLLYKQTESEYLTGNLKLQKKKTYYANY